MEAENFSLRWNDFEENISAGLQDMRNSNYFFDVTLLSDTGQVGAHKLILSACSTFFRQILVSNPHQHPLIYLKGVTKDQITTLLNFMYHGEVNVAQTELSSFLATAEDLKIKGLTNSDCLGASNSRENKSTNVPKTVKSVDTTTKSVQNKQDKATDRSQKSGFLQIKAEPGMITGDSPASDGTPNMLLGMTDNIGIVADPEDFIYDDYHSQESSIDDDYSINSSGASKGIHTFFPPVDDFSLLSSQGLSTHQSMNQQEHSRLRRKRQQILQFINQNKGRMADSYICLICNKTGTDNSNMNKHLEFKHGEELKEYLSGIPE